MKNYRIIDILRAVQQELAMTEPENDEYLKVAREFCAKKAAEVERPVDEYGN